MGLIENKLAGILQRTWWVLLLRGIAAMAFGVLTWIQPGISLAALVLLFGAYSFMDGILGVWTAFAGRKEHEHWWVLLLGGLLGIGVGVLTFSAPGVTALALLFYIAIWAIATGVASTRLSPTWWGRVRMQRRSGSRLGSSRHSTGSGTFSFAGSTFGRRHGPSRRKR